MIIVEDGTIVPNANSYVTRADYIDYCALRSVIIADDETADTEIVGGMDYVEIQRFIGSRVQTGIPEPLGFVDDYGYSDFYQLPAAPQPLSEQPCQWPRVGIYLNDTIPGSYRNIPNGLKFAQCQVALDIHNGFKPFLNIAAGQLTLSKKIGPLSLGYSEKQRTVALMPIAQGHLRGLLIGGALFSSTAYRV